MNFRHSVTNNDTAVPNNRITSIARFTEEAMRTCLTMVRQHAILEEVREHDRQATQQDYAEHCVAVRAARAGQRPSGSWISGHSLVSGVGNMHWHDAQDVRAGFAASIDRILAERPYVEPAVVQALEGYPYFD